MGAVLDGEGGDHKRCEDTSSQEGSTRGAEDGSGVLLLQPWISNDLMENKIEKAGAVPVFVKGIV